MNSTYAYNKIAERAKSEHHNFAYIHNGDINETMELECYDLFHLNLTDTDTFESPNCVMIKRAIAVHLPNQNETNPNWDYYTELCAMLHELPRPQYIAIEDGYVVGMVWCDFEGEDMVVITESELQHAIDFVSKKVDERDELIGIDTKSFPLDIRACVGHVIGAECERFCLGETKAIIDFINTYYDFWDLEFMWNNVEQNVSDTNDCGICMYVGDLPAFPTIRLYW